MNANRGMFLETIIERTIDYFASHNVGFLTKRYLPIKVYAFHGNKVEGWIKSKTQTDYYGIYKGFYFDFEAKQTKIANLPLANIKPHQLQHMKTVHEHGAIVFLIVYFQQSDCIYLLPYQALQLFFNQNQDRHSITESFFKEHGYVVDILYPGVLDLGHIFDELIRLRHQ